jgi:lipopolysaccharide/colanic/teichoic acid biosynthesis glycosyltransferase
MRVHFAGMSETEVRVLSPALEAEGWIASGKEEADIVLLRDDMGQGATGPQQVGNPAFAVLRSLPNGIPWAEAAMAQVDAGRIWHAPLSNGNGRTGLISAWHARLSPKALANSLAERVWEQTPNVVLADGQGGNVVYARIRRAIDIVFSLGVLLFAGWLILILWVLVRMTSRGPGFFTQERVGRHEKRFRLYKLRSMHQGTPDMPTHQASPTTVTAMGRFLRPTKLDELPQVINILRGELSLIGPRPGLPKQTELISARRRMGVFDVTPGLTGLAQVQGVDMKDAERLAQIDQHYVALQSLALDARIALATLGLWRFKAAPRPQAQA